MTFFRVKPEASGHFIVSPSRMTKLVKNEIFTYVEMRRFCIPFDYTTKVEASKRGNYYWDGHRFLPVDYPLKKSAERTAITPRSGMTERDYKSGGTAS